MAFNNAIPSEVKCVLFFIKSDAFLNLSKSDHKGGHPLNEGASNRLTPEREYFVKNGINFWLISSDLAIIHSATSRFL
jgi:hypothetical protein